MSIAILDRVKFEFVEVTLYPIIVSSLPVASEVSESSVVLVEALLPPAAKLTFAQKLTLLKISVFPVPVSILPFVGKFVVPPFSST